MPGVWFWLFCLAVIFMIVFVVLIEILGPRWYNWLILGVGLIIFFLSFGAYLMCCRNEKGEKGEKEVRTVYVTTAHEPEMKMRKPKEPEKVRYESAIPRNTIPRQTVVFDE